MKGLGAAALWGIAAALGAASAAHAQSIMIQSCKLPSGVTVVHNGHCDELKQPGDDSARPPMSATGGAARAPQGFGLDRDAFFALMAGTVTAECEKPKSKFTCLAKTPDVCRKTMPQAAAACEKSMKGQMPAQITSKEEGERWAFQLGQCVGNQFLVIAGPANLDANGCKATPGTTAAAADDSNDVSATLMSLLRKVPRVRR